MIRNLSLFAALIALTWSAASSPNESASSCLVNIKNDQEQSSHVFKTSDSNSNVAAFYTETSVYQNNCGKPIFALFRESNNNPPPDFRKSGAIQDQYLYPDTALARELGLNRVQVPHICEDGYSFAYCAEFVDDPLLPLSVLVETPDDAEAYESRKQKVKNHIETHIKQLSASNCYRAITSDEIFSDSAMNFAPIGRYFIFRQGPVPEAGMYRSFTIDGFHSEPLVLSEPLTDLWEMAPRQPHSGENILILH